MRTLSASMVIGLLVGAPLFAQTPAERIKALYDAVPYDRVKASPEVDILAHIDRMRTQEGDGAEAFAVPDLDLNTVFRETGDQDVLMNPGVLEAIARMTPDRAAQVLRMIEERRAGISPLEDVPPLSLSEEAETPTSLALRGWALRRDENGAPFLEREGDVSSRLMLVPSMILADFGRVVSIQDDEAGFRVTLESGDVLEGAIAPRPQPAAAEALAADARTGTPEATTPEGAAGTGAGAALAPQASEAPPSEVAEAADRNAQTPPSRSLRPVLRPVRAGG